MITFEGNSIVDLVTEALRYQALDAFVAKVLADVLADDSFNKDQKLAVKIETDRLVRAGSTVQQMLESIMNDGWSEEVAAVSVDGLTTQQRETIIGYVIDHAKDVLTDKAAALTALATANYTIPTEPQE